MPVKCFDTFHPIRTIQLGLLFAIIILVSGQITKDSTAIALRAGLATLTNFFTTVYRGSARITFTTAFTSTPRAGVYLTERLSIFNIIIASGNVI